MTLIERFTGKYNPTSTEAKEALANKSVELYEREQVVAAKEGLQSVVSETNAKIYQEKGNYFDCKIEQSTEFNKEKAEKMSEIAKLDAQIEYKKELIASTKNILEEKIETQDEAYKAIISEKDKTIDLLQENMKVLIGKLATVDLKGMNITLNK